MEKVIPSFTFETICHQYFLTKLFGDLENIAPRSPVCGLLFGFLCGVLLGLCLCFRHHFLIVELIWLFVLRCLLIQVQDTGDDGEEGLLGGRSIVPCDDSIDFVGFAEESEIGE